MRRWAMTRFIGALALTTALLTACSEATEPTGGSAEASSQATGQGDGEASDLSSPGEDAQGEGPLHDSVDAQGSADDVGPGPQDALAEVSSIDTPSEVNDAEVDLAADSSVDSDVTTPESDTPSSDTSAPTSEDAPVMSDVSESEPGDTGGDDSGVGGAEDTTALDGANGPEDVEANDAMSVDTTLGDDVQDADVETGPLVLESCPATLEITAPPLESFHLVGLPLNASVTVTGADDPASSMVRWENEAGEVLGQSAISAEGTSNVELDTAAIPLGMFTLIARLESSEGLCPESVSTELIFCQHEVSDDFSTLDEVSWKMFGSSYWDANGWLEMTGTAQGQRGAVYNPLTDVAAGSVSITFSMATGGGSGADGFAMTIVQTDSIAELEDEVIANAVPGSGIGYAVGGVYGPWDGNAFTVEIDTYQNVFNGTNELHTDPTPNDHVAITLDGDAGNHLWWTDMGDVEDLSWRTIRVDVIGFKVRVWIDGALLVEQLYPELQFRGGYIFFSLTATTRIITASMTSRSSHPPIGRGGGPTWLIWEPVTPVASALTAPSIVRSAAISFARHAERKRVGRASAHPALKRRASSQTRLRLRSSRTKVGRSSRCLGVDQATADRRRPRARLSPAPVTVQVAVEVCGGLFEGLIVLRREELRARGDRRHPCGEHLGCGPAQRRARRPVETGLNP